MSRLPDEYIVHRTPSGHVYITENIHIIKPVKCKARIGNRIVNADIVGTIDHYEQSPYRFSAFHIVTEHGEKHTIKAIHVFDYSIRLSFHEKRIPLHA